MMGSHGGGGGEGGRQCKQWIVPTAALLCPAQRRQMFSPVSVQWQYFYSGEGGREEQEQCAVIAISYSLVQNRGDPD